MFILDDIINAIGAHQASQQQQEQIQNAQNLMGQVYGQNTAFQQPWMQGGQQTFAQLLKGLQAGSFQPNINPQTLSQDPGYQFQMQEAQKALERSAAAHGNLNSGGFMKGLDQYSQGLAAQQFQNAWQRQFQQSQVNYQNLSNLAGMGLGAAQNIGTLGQGYGNSMAGLYGAMGNAQAAGTLGTTGNLANAYKSFGNLAMFAGGQ